MFDRLTLHGAGARLVWGFRDVAVLSSWRITKDAPHWRLSATFTRADRFQCQQAAKYKELLFTAPRDKGRWCFELADVTVGTTELRALLGKPLQ